MTMSNPEMMGVSNVPHCTREPRNEAAETTLRDSFSLSCFPSLRDVVMETKVTDLEEVM